MRNLYISLFIILFSSVTALAEWPADFSAAYEKNGIDDAVVQALSRGIAPKQIIATALKIPGLEQVQLIKALYCALAQPEDIQIAAEKNKISKETIAKGYELALGQCSRQMEERMNADQTLTPRFPKTAPSQRIRGNVSTSPSTFER